MVGSLLQAALSLLSLFFYFSLLLLCVSRALYAGWFAQYKTIHLHYFGVSFSLSPDACVCFLFCILFYSSFCIPLLFILLPLYHDNAETYILYLKVIFLPHIIMLTILTMNNRFVDFIADTNTNIKIFTPKAKTRKDTQAETNSVFFPVLSRRCVPDNQT